MLVVAAEAMVPNASLSATPDSVCGPTVKMFAAPVAAAPILVAAVGPAVAPVPPCSTDSGVLSPDSEVMSLFAPLCARLLLAQVRMLAKFELTCVASAVVPFEKVKG